VSRNENCDYRLSGMTQSAGRVMIPVKEGGAIVHEPAGSEPEVEWMLRKDGESEEKVT
jgi:hypothetical protein